MDLYKLGAKFDRESLKNNGVSIFVHDTLQWTNFNLDEMYKVQDIEACAVRINISCTAICDISIYRSPRGNFNIFTYFRHHSQFLTKQDNLDYYFRGL